MSMAGDRVQIDCLQLNIPGLTRAEAEHLERDVARLLERRLPVLLPRRKLDRLNLQVPLSDATPKNLLAEMIAKRIGESLS